MLKDCCRLSVSNIVPWHSAVARQVSRSNGALRVLNNAPESHKLLAWVLMRADCRYCRGYAYYFLQSCKSHLLSWEYHIGSGKVIRPESGWPSCRLSKSYVCVSNAFEEQRGHSHNAVITRQPSRCCRCWCRGRRCLRQGHARRNSPCGACARRQPRSSSSSCTAGNGSGGEQGRSSAGCPAARAC